jgi:alkyl hydroperoxide reductase subunit AhpC
MLGLSFPLFGDPRLNVFSLFGYERVLAIVRQSGTVVIDRQGVVAMLHRTANPFDALPFDEVLRTLVAHTPSPPRPDAT